MLIDHFDDLINIFPKQFLKQHLSLPTAYGKTSITVDSYLLIYQLLQY